MSHAGPSRAAVAGSGPTPGTAGGRWRAVLLVACVTAVLVLPPLGQRQIVTSDEARFPLLARDMLERGAWFEAYVREKQYRNKPPLYPWAIAVISLARGGVTEATAQLPVALAAIGAVTFAFLLGDRLFGRRAGLWGALVLATSYNFFSHSQELLPDMLVVCFATAAGLAFWRAATAATATRDMVLFYGALGLAVFAKGPLGLLPLLPVALWLWRERGGLRLLWSPGGIGLFAAITLAWLTPFLALGASSFGATVIWTNWLGWFFGLPRPAVVGEAILDGLKGFMPWTLLALAAVPAARRARSDPRVRFALLWFVVPLVVILLSENQRERYLLAVYPGLALLVGWWVEAHAAARPALARVAAWGGLALAAIGTLVLLAPPVDAVRLPFADDGPWVLLPLLLGVILLGGTLFVGLETRRPRLAVRGTAVGMILLLGYGTPLYNAWSNETQDFRGLAAAVERHALGGDVRVWGGRLFSLDFYLGRSLLRVRSLEEFNEYVARPDRPIVVVNVRTWEEARSRIPPRVRVLETMLVRGQDMLIVRDGAP